MGTYTTAIAEGVAFVNEKDAMKLETGCVRPQSPEEACD